MNVYLFPWHTKENCSITKIVARNYQDCEFKIKEIYLDRYEDLDDLLDFDDFCRDLYDKHGVVIGDIFEIDEFI